MAVDRPIYFRCFLMTLAAFAATRSPADECGVLKPFSVHVQRVAHRNAVEVPLAHCKTAEGPCKAAGYEFVVLSKATKYRVFLVDGTGAKLKVGSDYAVRLTCGEVELMMITTGESESDLTSLFVLEEEEIRSKPD